MSATMLSSGPATRSAASRRAVSHRAVSHRAVSHRAASLGAGSLGPVRYSVVVPARLADPRPTTTVYVRRRLLVGLVLLTTVFVLWFGAGSVLANRGGAPASTPTVRPAATYVAQAGDTLWSIAEAHHGDASVATYVDALIAANGGTDVQIGQQVILP